MYSVYVPMFVTFLGTGLRVGELLGLTWADIDLKNGVITVNKQLLRPTHKKQKVFVLKAIV